VTVEVIVLVPLVVIEVVPLVDPVNDCVLLAVTEADDEADEVSVLDWEVVADVVIEEDAVEVAELVLVELPEVEAVLEAVLDPVLDAVVVPELVADVLADVEAVDDALDDSELVALDVKELVTDDETEVLAVLVCDDVAVNEALVETVLVPDVEAVVVPDVDAVVVPDVEAVDVPVALTLEDADDVAVDVRVDDRVVSSQL
jgi:hypothetical protein